MNNEKPAKRSAKRKAVRSPEREQRLAKQADRAERQRLKELKERLPPKRERLTPVKRLRRRAVGSDQPLRFGYHGAASPGQPTSSNQPTRPNPTDQAVTPSAGGVFRLVCWNIEDGIDIDGTIDGLTNHKNLVGAAAICLQEMDLDGVEQIAAKMNLNYVYLESSKDERTERGFGNAVLSPHTLTNGRATPLPHAAKAYGRPRAAVSATVNWPSDSGLDSGLGLDSVPVSVWSLHAEIPSLSLSKRVAQYTAAAAKATATNPEHLLIAGDFNTTTITSVVALDELYELFDLDRLSFPAGPSLRRAGRLFYLDHIYGRGMRVEAVGVESDVIASDHWPMWVDVSPDGRQ